MKKYLRDRWIVNIVLLAISIMLVLLVMLDEEPTSEVHTLGSYLNEPINEIRINRQGRQEIHFRLSGDYWQMLNPYQARAETSLVNQILGLVSLEANKVADTQAINLADFGLAPPDMSIHLNQQQIDFGDSQPVNKQRYIELAGQILLIPDRFMMHLKTGSISYIDRHLLPQGSKINSLKIGDSTIDPDGPNNQSTAWQSIKANWVSLAAEDQQAKGIDIRIELQGETAELHYIAEKREADVVLTDMQSRLEYHLPITSYDSLGIVFDNETRVAADDDAPSDNK
jgi:hypothetical protein